MNWISRTIRDDVVDFVTMWTSKLNLPTVQFIKWLGISSNRFYDWKKRFGKVNEHNALIPSKHWILESEKQAIIEFYKSHPECGYRLLTFMMIDADIVAVSPSTTYRVLVSAKLLVPRDKKPTKKGSGFKQPEKPHEHWHVDISYINVCGSFYYLCSVLDGYSRYIVNHCLCYSCKEEDVELIIQTALDKFPGAKPRIITDNGPQFIANEFKVFVRYCETTHVTTSPYYPQSNGKIERWHKSLKSECIRVKTPVSYEDAERCIATYINEYNYNRLHSAHGYITPHDMLCGNEVEIRNDRKRKMEEAHQNRMEHYYKVQHTELAGDLACVQ